MDIGFSPAYFYALVFFCHFINSVVKATRMNRLLFCACLLFMLQNSYGQTDSASYYYEKGLQEKEKGRIVESWKNFDKAYQYNSADISIIRQLAHTLLGLRKYAQALEMFKQAEKIGDTSIATCKQLLLLSNNLRLFDDVLYYADRLKKLCPGEKTSFITGKVQYDRENYAEAIKHLLIAQEEELENAEIPYLIARCYADMMNYKQAVPFFEKSISLDSTKNSRIYELALVCYAMHADKEALRYMLLAAEKGYKKDNDYLENLGIAYLNAGRPQEGLTTLMQVLANKPTDLNLLNMIAEAYYAQAKFKEAINYWDAALAADKNNAAALYMIGMCYQKMGDKAKGVALCDKAIEMDPSLTSLRQKKMMTGL